MDSSQNTPHVTGDSPDSASMAAQDSHLGSARSWVCVVVMIVGFTVAGFGMTQDPPWPWIIGGGAAFVLGGIAALLLGITRDVVVDDLDEEPAHRPDTGATAPKGGSTAAGH